MQSDVGQIGRLAAFLEAARPLLRKTTVPSRIAGPHIPLDRFGEVLGRLRGLMDHARSAGEGLNPWRVAGLRHYEVRNASVLAAFWNPAVCGGSAIDYLAGFLQRLDRPDLPTREQLAKGFQVRTEHSPLPGESSERIDITVEGVDFVVAIEIKIRAPESGEGQFNRYSQTSENWSRLRAGKRASFILVAQARPMTFSGHFASWADVSWAARKCLPVRRAAYTYHDHLLASFADHIDEF